MSDDLRKAARDVGARAFSAGKRGDAAHAFDLEGVMAAADAYAQAKVEPLLDHYKKLAECPACRAAHKFHTEGE